MIFPYVRRWPGEPYRPIIPVLLRRGEACVGAFALVDSGADRSLFDAQYAGELGIEDITTGVPMKFAGVSGRPFTAYAHTVMLRVGELDIVGIPIAFSADMGDDEVGILGQEGFFDKFPILFTYNKREINFIIEHSTLSAH